MRALPIKSCVIITKYHAPILFDLHKCNLFLLHSRAATCPTSNYGTVTSLLRTTRACWLLDWSGNILIIIKTWEMEFGTWPFLCTPCLVHTLYRSSDRSPIVLTITYSETSDLQTFRFQKPNDEFNINLANSCLSQDW